MSEEASLAAVLTAVQSLREHMDSRFDALEERQGAFEQRQLALEERQSALEARVAAFRADLVDELGRTRSELMARISRLQNDLQGQRDEVFVTNAIHDATERMARSALEQIRGLHKLIRNLQEQVEELRGKT